MEIKEYSEVYFQDVYEVVHKTIEEIYPKYYPRSAVDFFHNHHSKEKMEKQLPNEVTMVLSDENKIIGIGSLFENEIRRFFILPEYQGKGYGKILLNELEKRIDKNEKYILDSSLGAVEFYRKNGYLYKEAAALSIFKEVQASADPQTIILAEYAFLSQELQFCSENDKDTLSSLTQAVQSFDDAFLALKVVEDKTLYQGAENTHPHSRKYRISGYPKDSYHIACLAHKTRLQNILRAPA